MSTEDLAARCEIAAREAEAAKRTLRTALLTGGDTAAAREFLAEAEGEVQAAAEALAAAEEAQHVAAASELSGRADELAAAAAADLHARLAAFRLPAPPTILHRGEFS